MDFNLSLISDFQLKFGAHTISVEFVSPDHPKLSEKNQGYTFGDWDIKTRTISIRNDLPYSLRLSTLIHECLHIIEDFYSVRISHKDLNLTGDMMAGLLLDNFVSSNGK